MAEYPYKFKHSAGDGEGSILAKDKKEAEKLVRQIADPQLVGSEKVKNLTIEISPKIPDSNDKEVKE